MTSKDHIDLSDFIKSIHKKLRNEATILGTEEAWKKHCQDEENLAKYASAMRKLAEDHWESNFDKNRRHNSRVTWVFEACNEYFIGIVKRREKEEKVRLMMNLDRNCYTLEPCDKLALLDVGSCYNPFKKYSTFQVTPIDIAPANNDVIKCDFLNVTISNSTVLNMDQNTIIQLQSNSFHIVVFSLLLEYFPNPQQRLQCCQKAFNLLKPEGILAIITPDSNHVGSNAKVFKSWRFVLAKEGFIRVKYEKLPYLHCMLFRKAIYGEVAERWAVVHGSEKFYGEMFIPQDFSKGVE